MWHRAHFIIWKLKEGQTMEYSFFLYHKECDVTLKENVPNNTPKIPTIHDRETDIHVLEVVMSKG